MTHTMPSNLILSSAGGLAARRRIRFFVACLITPPCGIDLPGFDWLLTIVGGGATGNWLRFSESPDVSPHDWSLEFEFEEFEEADWSNKICC